MLKELLKKKEFSILAIIVVLSIILTILSPVFLNIGNFVDMAKGNAVFGIMALGMLLVLISGGIDLSVTANVTLTSLVTGVLLMNTELNMFLILIASMGVGGIVGLVNGLIITKIKIPPMVATLGTNSVILGSVLFATEGNMITGLPKWYQDFGMMSFLNVGDFKIPVQVIFYIGAIAATFFLLKYTLLGRGIYAVGGSESSASRVGYNVDNVKIFIYSFCGLLVGLAGFINTSIVQGVNPNTFVGIDMTIISIAVIGGASTLGGVGTVLGTVLGTILMAVINNGLILARVPTFYQKIVMGGIILLAVTIDVTNRKKEKAKLVRVDVEE